MEYDSVTQLAHLTDEERDLTNLPEVLPLDKCAVVGELLLEHAEVVREIRITQAATESWIAGVQPTQEEAMEAIRNGTVFEEVLAFQRLGIALQSCGIGETTEADLNNYTKPQ